MTFPQLFLSCRARELNFCVTMFEEKPKDTFFQSAKSHSRRWHSSLFQNQSTKGPFFRLKNWSKKKKNGFNKKLEKLEISCAAESFFSLTTYFIFHTYFRRKSGRFFPRLTSSLSAPLHIVRWDSDFIT